MRSNLSHWQEMQEADYFEHHPCYNGLVDKGDDEVSVIERFVQLVPEMKVVVIGCGYGRETVHISKRVGHVFGIDVSKTILAKARNYLQGHGVNNFTLVSAENYKRDIPAGIDLVFSVVVMQHLTRDLVADYFSCLGNKLQKGGTMIIQFLEELGTPCFEAELKVYEPSVSWTAAQLVELACSSNLELREIRSYLATQAALWHWAYFVRP